MSTDGAVWLTSTEKEEPRVYCFTASTATAGGLLPKTAAAARAAVDADG